MYKFKILVGVVALVFSALTFSATAQELEPEHLALAKQYVQMTDTGHLYERLIVETTKVNMQALVQQNPEISSSIVQASRDLANQYFEGGDNALHDTYARIYATVFSQEELAEIIAFYETPTGQKLIGTVPIVGSNLETATRIWKENMETEVAVKLRSLLRERGFDV